MNFPKKLRIIQPYPYDEMKKHYPYKKMRVEAYFTLSGKRTGGGRLRWRCHWKISDFFIRAMCSRLEKISFVRFVWYWFFFSKLIYIQAKLFTFCKLTRVEFRHDLTFYIVVVIEWLNEKLVYKIPIFNIMFYVVLCVLYVEQCSKIVNIKILSLFFYFV